MAQEMTSGHPLGLILKFSVPLLIGNFFQQLYNMADMAVVGRTLGTNAVAAVGAAGAPLFLILGLFWGLTGGVTTIAAQRFGAKDQAGVRRSVAMSLMVCGGISLVMTVFSLIFCRVFLRWMNTPEDIFEDCFSYTFWIFAGIPVSTFFILSASILRAIGDSRTPLIFLIISSLINVGLDIFFIKGFGTGPGGAAVATVLAQFISGILCFVYAWQRYPILHLSRRDWHFRWRFAWAHLRIGIPMAFQFVVIGAGIMVMQSVLNTFGSVAVAAYSSAARLDQLAIQPIFSFGIAVATYTAQNYGARRFDRIYLGLKQCTIFMLIFSACAAAFMIIGYPRLTRLFLGAVESEVLRLIGVYIWCSSLFFPLLSMIAIYRNALQGIGYAFVPLMAAVIELVMRSIGAPIMGVRWGYIGVCGSNQLAWCGGAILLIPFYFWAIRRLHRRHELQKKQSNLR